MSDGRKTRLQRRVISGLHAGSAGCESGPGLGGKSVGAGGEPEGSTKGFGWTGLGSQHTLCLVIEEACKETKAAKGKTRKPSGQ